MELGTGPKPVARKKDLGDSLKSKTKRGQHLSCRRKKQKKLSKSSKISRRRARARARGVHNSSSKRKSSSKESASIVEEITSSGTTRSGRKYGKNSPPRETSYLAPFAIQTGNQDGDFCLIAEMTMEGDGAGESHQCNKCKDKQKRRQKKRYPRSPELEAQLWQAQGSELLYVVSAGPRLAHQNQLAWEACMVDDDALSDSTKGGMAVEVVESVWSMDSSSKTPRRTLELVGWIGKRLVRMLIDSGAIGNYISAQECIVRKIKIEKKKNGKELTMDDGSKVKTLG